MAADGEDEGMRGEGVGVLTPGQATAQSTAVPGQGAAVPSQSVSAGGTTLTAATAAGTNREKTGTANAVPAFACFASRKAARPPLRKGKGQNPIPAAWAEALPYKN